jgi:hypothetical protein
MELIGEREMSRNQFRAVVSESKSDLPKGDVGSFAGKHKQPKNQFNGPSHMLKGHE